MTTTAPPMLPLALLEGNMARPRKQTRIEATNQPFIGTRGAAAILGVSRQRIDQMLDENKIKSAYRVDGNGLWIMSRAEIEALGKG